MRWVGNEYELGELLHRGSRWDVRAVEGTDDLVVKVRHPTHDVVQKAALDPEVVLTALARSSALVRIVDFGEAEGRSFLVMERIRGAMTLADSLSRIGPLAPRAALPILYQLVRGVRDLHRAGIAHRDLRLENVVLGPSGARPPRVYLFGLHAGLHERDPGTQSDSPDDRLLDALRRDGRPERRRPTRVAHVRRDEGLEPRARHQRPRRRQPARRAMRLLGIAVIQKP